MRDLSFKGSRLKKWFFRGTWSFIRFSIILLSVRNWAVVITRSWDVPREGKMPSRALASTVFMEGKILKEVPSSHVHSLVLSLFKLGGMHDHWLISRLGSPEPLEFPVWAGIFWARPLTPPPHVKLPATIGEAMKTLPWHFADCVLRKEHKDTPDNHICDYVWETKV